MFYWIRLASGVFVLISAVMFLWALFVPGKERNPPVSSAIQPAE